MQKAIAVDLYSGDRIEDFGLAKAAGVELVILKASEGMSIKDSTYRIRRDAARKAGLLVAAYHFSTTAPVQTQVQNFLSVVLPDADPSLRLVLDWEDHDGQHLTAAGAKEFMRALDFNTNRRTVLYASASFLMEQLGTTKDPEFADHPLWIAAYRDSGFPPVPQASWQRPILWQYTGDGVGGFPRAVPGISGNSQSQLDVNSSPYLTVEQFRAAWLGGDAPAASHDDWIWIQTYLKAAGLYSGVIDDAPGKLTRKAVAAYIDGGKK